MEPNAVFKALGDDTRYAIYTEVARSSVPLATADIASTLKLHPNTVRPHLERMREVGLLDVEVEARGSVGRPQHYYFVAAEPLPIGAAAESPSIGPEPPALALLAEMLAALVAAASFTEDEMSAMAVGPGRDMAITMNATRPSPRGTAGCTEAVVSALGQLGFDPAVVEGDDSTTVAFAHCPYMELAQAHPEVVCHLHRGLTEGLAVEMALACGVEVRASRFSTLTDRDPCRITLSFR